MPHRKFIRSQQQKKKERNEKGAEKLTEQKSRSRRRQENIKMKFICEWIGRIRNVDPTKRENFLHFGRRLSGQKQQRDRRGLWKRLDSTFIWLSVCLSGPSWLAQPDKAECYYPATAHVFTQLHRRAPILLIRPETGLRNFSFRFFSSMYLSTIEFVRWFYFAARACLSTFVCSRHSPGTRQEHVRRVVDWITDRRCFTGFLFAFRLRDGKKESRNSPLHRGRVEQGAFASTRSLALLVVTPTAVQLLWNCFALRRSFWRFYCSRASHSVFSFREKVSF